jgi:hypothetical protein
MDMDDIIFVGKCIHSIRSDLDALKPYADERAKQVIECIITLMGTLNDNNWECRNEQAKWFTDENMEQRRVY